MKTNVKAVLVIALVFFGGNTFGQTTGTRSDKIKNDQVTRTYLDLLLNVVSTNFNYGKANGSFADYKKSTFGAQIGASFQAGITPKV
jgi:hypothetical protein